jgi:hypothetical protein
MATHQKGICRLLKRRPLVIRLALAFAVVSLAVPGAAAAYTVSGGFTGGPSASPDQGSITASHQVVLRRDGSQAVPFTAPSPAASPNDTNGGFDWGDAMIGAGSALALVALLGAGGLTIRSRRPVAHAEPTQG